MNAALHIILCGLIFYVIYSRTLQREKNAATGRENTAKAPEISAAKNPERTRKIDRKEHV